MITLFGIITLGRLPDEQQRHQRLLRELKKIMVTLNEVKADLATANQLLETQNSLIADTKALVVKVGSETDKLKQIIDNLPPVGDAPADLVAELDKLKATINNTVALVGETKDAIGVVDAKVPDETPPPAPA